MKIEYVTIHPVTTTIGWDDGTTTSVESGKNDVFNVQTGILWAIAKKFLAVSDILKAFEMGEKSTILYAKNQRALRLNKEMDTK